MYHHPVGHLKGAPGPILQRARRALHWLGAQRAAQGGRQAPVRSGCDGTPSAGPPRACKEPTGCCVPGAHWVSVAPPRWTPQGRARNPLAACQARTGMGGAARKGTANVMQGRVQRNPAGPPRGVPGASVSQVRVWRHSAGHLRGAPKAHLQAARHARSGRAASKSDSQQPSGQSVAPITPLYPSR